MARSNVRFNFTVTVCRMQAFFRAGPSAPGAVICADESDAYDLLPARSEVRRVHHSQEYRANDGTTNNLAESYFSRFRRFQTIMAVVD